MSEIINNQARLFSNLDFTLNRYEKLCRTIVESKYISLTLGDYLKSRVEETGNPSIIMRHDIDRSPRCALRVAKIEHKYGIFGTYYFRDRRHTFVPAILDEIASLGHEIGYHYENIDKCKGNVESAKLLFEKELNGFRRRYDVKTVCAHGNPLTPWDNKDIWKSARFADYGLLGEAFLSLDYGQFAYFSDSGRTWVNNKSQKMPGKDSVETAFSHLKPKNTDDVIEIVKEETLPNICILTHPERWRGDVIGFIGKYFLDLAFSWGKVAIYSYRKAVNSEAALHH